METTRSALIQAIYGQESSYGKADTSQPNYAGARGPMQVTHSTFEGMKGKGLIPADWRHDNPEHTTKAGVVLINHLADKFGDDPRKVAAAYYAGEKAVRADGTIADFRDRKNPRAPTTLQYVDQVLGRMGVPGAAPVAAPAPVRGPVRLDAAMPARNAPAQAPAGPVVGLAPDVAPKVQADPNAAPVAVGTAADAAQRAAQESADTSVMDVARASFMHNNVLGAIGKLAVAPKFKDEPGFSIDPKLLAGKNSDEQEELMEAGSQQEVDFLLFDQSDRIEQARIAGLRGTGVGLVGGMLSGLPEGYALGLGAFKAFQVARIGSTQLALQGRAGAAWASAAAENIGGNVAATAAGDMLGQHYGMEDYALGVAFGAAVTPLVARGALSEAEGVFAQQAADKIAAEAAAKLVAKRDTALRNLGPDATPEQIAAEIDRISAAEVQTTLGTKIDRKLIADEADEVGEIVQPTSALSVSDIAGNIGVKPIFVNTPDAGNPVIRAEGIVDKPSIYSFQEADQLEAYWDNLDGRIQLPDGSITTKGGHVKNEWGIDVNEVRSLPVGVHTRPSKGGVVPDANMVRVTEWVQKHFLGDQRIILQTGDDLSMGTLGDAYYVGKNTMLIRARAGQIGTLVHELGHAILTTQWRNLQREGVKAGFKEWHADWVRNYTSGRPSKGNATGALQTALERGAVSSHYTSSAARPNPDGFFASLFDIMQGVVNRAGTLQKGLGDTEFSGNYIPNFDEFGAEQFLKYVEATAADVLPWKPASIPKDVLDWFRNMWDKFANLFNKAKKEGWLAPDTRAVDFFEAVRKVNKAAATKEARAAAGVGVDRNYGPKGPDGKSVHDAAMPSQSVAPDQETGWRADPIARKYGLDLLPDASPAQAAEAKAILNLYKRADDPRAPWNNIDQERIKSITDNGVFNVASTSLLMLKSDNPVVRMVAAELLENPAGAAGRRSTAAIAAYMNQRAYTGNIVNEMQDSYRVWRTQNGGSVMEDAFGGKKWEQFNLEVAQEIERRANPQHAGSAHPAVITAANAVEAAFERMRKAQVERKTIGWGGLPETSKGYLPHRMSPEKIRNMTQAQRQSLHAALVDQFVQIEGFDISFSAQLASQYIDRVNTRAAGGFDAPIGVHQVGAAEIVEDALTAMGMNRDEVVAMMKRYMRGGAGHTKGRLKLDLLQTDENGFRLLDLFDTNVMNLVRSQAQRVAGEVALADFGVMGQPGLKLLRQAMMQGGDVTKAQAKELEAFDQVAAEFLGQPFGKAGSRWMDRAIQTTALARLGGMGFTQFAEALNGIWHLGAARALGTIPAMVRLRSEVKALARGEKVQNPLLGSIERFAGVDFGTDSYKIKFPFDNGSLEYVTYGKDTVTMADRALRGATHLQGKLSLWRSIHAAQQRGMAEQIVAKAARYIKEGTDDIALADMGIDAGLVARLRNDIDEAAKWEGGQLREFDITKFRDTQAANDFVQAVHRGTSQIIQGVFIGETGKWAHDSLLRVLTQFRTFSITSVEKQWARQRGNYGVAKALGMLLGSMAFAAPIYVARTYANSVGREDQEAYLDRQLSAAQIARASLNYVAMSGLSGDLLDALTAISGAGAVTGGRSGAASQFVGNVIAPSAGLADDLWRAMQNTKEGTDIHELAKNLPFSKLPVLQQAINGLD